MQMNCRDRKDAVSVQLANEWGDLAANVFQKLGAFDELELTSWRLSDRIYIQVQ